MKLDYAPLGQQCILTDASYHVLIFRSTKNLYMGKIEHVVWDGDNTIWGWLEYAVPAYEAMASVIASISGKGIDEVAAAMKEFYSSAGTLEHEGLVQGLQSAGFFDGVEDFNLDSTIREAQAAFSKVRNQKLSVYPGISAVMGKIHERGINQIMITDAPGGQAAARLRRSKLSSYINDIYAMSTPDISDIPEGFRRHFQADSSPRVHVLPNEKPHIDLEAIFGLTRERIAESVAIIGDNMAKDIELARLYGCIGIHAKYGAANPDLGARIGKFAPARVAGRSMEVDSYDRSSGRIIGVNNAREILGVI